MKKLNKRELTALAQKIWRDLSDEFTKKWEAELKISEKSRTAKIKTINKELSALSPATKEYLESLDKRTFVSKHVVTHLKNTVECKQLVYGDKARIEDELVLAQIDCDSLDGIIAKVTAKFRK